jgi:hypothetical protein
MDGVEIFAAAYEVADERTREFMRKIAPHLCPTESSYRPQPGDRVVVYDKDGSVVWDVVIGDVYESDGPSH